MHTFLSVLAAVASRRPALAVAALAVLTVVLGSFASEQRTDTDFSSFAPESELADTLGRVQDEFGAGGRSLQVVLDAGPGGDVLSPEGVTVAAAVHKAVTGAGVALPDGAVRSFASPLLAALAGTGVDATTLTVDEVDRLVGEALGPETARMLSVDANLAAGTARAGLVMVSFPPTMPEREVEEASVLLAERVRAVDAGGLEIAPFNWAVMTDALERESMTEMPRLLGLSMLLIVVILAIQFRRVSDVAVAVAGLVVTITWMTGISVLLGPGYLGLVGPFSQISMIVPVLLVGLGVDYAIHLTARYREERAGRAAPRAAAAISVRTVGGALTLATVTTMLGFLTNVVSPLPPMADFGVFTAVGVLCAFVVMSVLVPSARSLIDGRTRRRRIRPGPLVVAGPRGLARAVGHLAVLAERLPRVTLAAALGVSLLAVGAATQVGTTFSQDEFVPADSDIGRLLDRMDVLFAGDLEEVTFVVVDGDITDPDAANALLALGRDLATVDGVRVADGVAQVSSPAAAVAAAVAAAPDIAAEAERLGYAPGAGFRPDADMGALYALAHRATPAQIAQLVRQDGRAGVVAVATNAGQDGARALYDDLAAALEPLRAAGLVPSVTSEPLVMEEALDALTASQTRGIAVTLLAALVLLASYYGLAARAPAIGVITMIPSLAVVTWVLGTMWVLGISFNVLTAMVASIGIGIGVPFGIHVTHRFLEDRRRYATADEAIRETVTHTGGAMAGSAATTAAGFGVLVIASLAPMRQFGTIIAITIVYSFIAAVLVQPACLKLWAERRGSTAVRTTPATASPSERTPEPV